MRTKSKTCSRSWRAGLTLIEVIAAIAILGTILVGVVLAKARHTRQTALAARVLHASHAADELIAGWWASPDGVPVGRRGTFGDGDTPRLHWATRVVSNPAIEALGARVIRVQVRGDESNLEEGTEMALVTVDLVLPLPSDEQADEQAGDSSSGKRDVAGVRSNAVAPGEKP